MPLLIGTLASILLVGNILITAIFLFTFTFLKIIIPIPAVRRVITHILVFIANSWVSGNSLWMRLTQRMDWSIELPEQLIAMAGTLSSVITNPGWISWCCSTHSTVEFRCLSFS